MWNEKPLSHKPSHHSHFYITFVSQATSLQSSNHARWCNRQWLRPSLLMAAATMWRHRQWMPSPVSLASRWPRLRPLGPSHLFPSASHGCATTVAVPPMDLLWRREYALTKSDLFITLRWRHKSWHGGSLRWKRRIIDSFVIHCIRLNDEERWAEGGTAVDARRAMLSKCR